MNKDFPCTCGHYYSDHRIGGFIIPGDFCHKCYDSRSEDTDDYSWHTFKPDNLKYLEQIYEKTL